MDFSSARGTAGIEISYLIWRVQCKLKRRGPWFKKCQDFQDRKSRALNREQDLLRASLVASVQFSHSVVSTLCDPMNCSTPGLPVHHQLLEFTQTHIHRVGDAIQPSHPLSSPSPPAFNLAQYQGLFQLVGSSHQVAKGLEFQLQHQSFQWIFRTDFL